MTSFDQEITETQKWFDSPRFAGTTRLYTARQVVDQRGTIAHDYTVAREAAVAFYERLRQLFGQSKNITTFGPYSPGQAVVIKRMGIEGIYLGGWATSAKGSTSEDPGPDLASYPLSQVPDEAATLVRERRSRLRLLLEPRPPAPGLRPSRSGEPSARRHVRAARPAGRSHPSPAPSGARIS